jgi:hypothetical protein
MSRSVTHLGILCQVRQALDVENKEGREDGATLSKYTAMQHVFLKPEMKMLEERSPLTPKTAERAL